MSKEINALVDDLIAIATSLFVDGNQEACTNFVDELKLFKEEKNSFKKEKLRSQENSHLMVCPLAWLRKNAVEKILSEMTTRRTVVNLIYERDILEVKMATISRTCDMLQKELETFSSGSKKYPSHLL